MKNYYPEGKAETPFNPQLEHFDWICGQVRNENKILKIVVIISCLAFFLSIGITMYAISMPDVVPVLVTMDDFGRTQYVGEITRKNYQNFQVPQVSINYTINNFLTLLHFMSTDKYVMNKNIENIYHFLTSNTSSRYNTYVKENDLFKDFGEKTREIVFDTEPLALSKESYQIDYTVVTRNLAGHVEKEERFRALISIKTMQPSKEDIKINHLGIYITSFDIKPLTK